MATKSTKQVKYEKRRKSEIATKNKNLKKQLSPDKFAEERKKEAKRKCEYRVKKNESFNAEELELNRKKEAKMKCEYRVKKNKSLNVEELELMKKKEAKRGCEKRLKKNESLDAEELELDRKKEAKRKCEYRVKKNESLNAGELELMKKKEAKRGCEKRLKKNESLDAEELELNRKKEAKRRCEQRLKKKESLNAEELELERKNETSRRYEQRISKNIQIYAGIANTDIMNGSNIVIDISNSNKSIGEMSSECKYCGALKFTAERPSQCCCEGKVMLPTFPEPPSTISKLWNDRTGDSKLFRSYARTINNSICFASIRVGERKFPGYNPCVIFEGKLHHIMGSLIPQSETAPIFAQMYIQDFDLKDSKRFNNLFLPASMKLSEKLHIQRIVDTVRSVMAHCNPFANDFKHIMELEKKNILHGKIIISANARPKGEHKRKYNEQVCLKEISILKDSKPHDLVLEKRGGGLKIISNLNPNGMPLHFTLLFPHGTKGWCPDLKQNSEAKKRITPRQFYAFHANIRKNNTNYLFKAMRLFQEWLCVAWAVVEDQKLNYLRSNQSCLRVDSYKNVKQLQDQLYADDNCQTKIGRVILPSTYIGCPRYYNQQFQDGMAICRRYHKPDLFITMTCNPNWAEIKAQLEEGQSPHDRPDIIARVFKLKKDQLTRDLKDLKIFGEVKGFMEVVEYQKRGLPHCHILVILDKKSRKMIYEKIDDLVCAELPLDPETFTNEQQKEQAQRLEQLVISNMVHGPCGEGNPKAPCMENGKCSKGFKKSFQNETSIDFNMDVPKYRRRRPENGGRQIETKKNRIITNQDIVPYNVYLLLRYGCHINLEICTNARAAKYLYKYVTKGEDRAMVKTSIGSNFQAVNEIDDYSDLRSFGPVESAWRLFSFPIAQHSPTVMPLRVHLDGHQAVVFSENNLEKNLTSARKTELTAFFEFNKIQISNGDNPKNLPRYVDMPEKYRFIVSSKQWVERKRLKQEKTIGRVHSIHPLAGEVFYLRMLLHSDHCRGAKSFDDLLITNDDAKFESFKSVCLHLGLLSDDSEWSKVLEDAAHTKLCSQIRDLYVSILIFCEVSNANELFEKFWSGWVDDILIKFKDKAINVDEAQLKILVLIDIETRLKCFEKTLPDFGLNIPTKEQRDNVKGLISGVPAIIQDELDFSTRILKERVFKTGLHLTCEQRLVFKYVMDSITQNTQILCFLDARGGCGKTFLINQILDAVRCSTENGCIALGMAMTGIASTLINKGRTFHSRMKAPLDPASNSTLNINANSDLATLIRESKLILVDEATMMDAFLLDAMDVTLKDIMNESNKPFGGKNLFFAGDFRQCLPVIKGASRGGITQRCIKNSKQWRHFKTLKLTTNLRLKQDNDQTFHNFDTWTLRIGDGAENTVNVPNANLWKINSSPLQIQMKSFVETIYPNLCENFMNPDWMCGRVILSPTNKEVDMFNELAIDGLPEEPQILLSSDTLTEDADICRFNVEYLNSLRPQGFPPHNLKVKPGMPLTLLRNLSPRQGLCNGTRIIFISMINPQLMQCRLSEKGTEVLIPRISFIPQKGEFGFDWRRRQFPVRAAFGMTINKSQGQTLKRVGLWLHDDVFTHGQLYVGVSRVSDPKNLTIACKNNSEHFFINNMVFNEVLN